MTRPQREVFEMRILETAGHLYRAGKIKRTGARWMNERSYLASLRRSLMKLTPRELMELSLRMLKQGGPR